MRLAHGRGGCLARKQERAGKSVGSCASAGVVIRSAQGGAKGESLEPGVKCCGNVERRRVLSCGCAGRCRPAEAKVPRCLGVDDESIGRFSNDQGRPASPEGCKTNVTRHD